MELTFGKLAEDDIWQLDEIVSWFMKFDPEQIRAFLSEEQNVTLIAKLGGKVIGLIYGYRLTRMDGKTPQFFMYSVDIHSEYQNKGYGSRFVQYAVDWARDTGYSEVFVPTEKDNVRACRVYEKAGMKHSEKDCNRGYEITFGDV